MQIPGTRASAAASQQGISAAETAPEAEDAGLQQLVLDHRWLTMAQAGVHVGHSRHLLPQLRRQQVASVYGASQLGLQAKSVKGGPGC